MSDEYLDLVLEEAQQLINHQPTDTPTAEINLHEYLRFAIHCLLESEAERTYTKEPRVPRVTVGYASDQAMFETWGSDVDWWSELSPQANASRFWVFYPATEDGVPLQVGRLMEAIGAWRVWTGDPTTPGVSDFRDRRETHYLWPHDHPIVDLLAARVQATTATATAVPDGGVTRASCTDGLAQEAGVRQTGAPDEELAPRTRRAIAESMDVSLLAKGGQYEVQSESGNSYVVDIVGESCSCPDWNQRTPAGGCKHMRRVDREIKRGSVPRPDGRVIHRRGSDCQLDCRSNT